MSSATAGTIFNNVYDPTTGQEISATASNVVGSVVDSCLFLWLAFGSLDFLAGQLVGKWEVTAATVAVLWWWRRSRRGSF